MTTTIVATVPHFAVVPLVETDLPEDAVRPVATVVRADLPVVALTLCPSARPETVSLVATEVPEWLVEARSLLNPKMVRSAANSGTKFSTQTLGTQWALRAIAAPFAAPSVRFIATDNVGVESICDNHALPFVSAVADRRIAAHADVGAKSWQTVHERKSVAAQSAREATK